MIDDKQLAATQRLLRHMMEVGKFPDLTAFTRKAGLAHSTISRHLAAKSGDGLSSITTTTWMKLSEVSGVSVTISGQQMFPTELNPGQGKASEDPRVNDLLKFCRDLPPEQKNAFFVAFDAWAASYEALTKII